MENQIINFKAEIQKVLLSLLKGVKDEFALKFRSFKSVFCKTKFQFKTLGVRKGNYFIKQYSDITRQFISIDQYTYQNKACIFGYILYSGA